jgi:mRNA-degrading endonuclease toxin of MazEF toxin-antitoxin module
MQAGDVVIAQLPFQWRQGAKHRPAVVIATSGPALLVTPITSSPGDADDAIDPLHQEAMGLDRQSHLVTRIVTRVDRSSARRIGRTPPSLWAEIQDRARPILEHDAVRARWPRSALFDPRHP